MKRFLSLLLVFALALSCTPAMPIQVQAATGEQSAFEGYTPVSNKEELDAIRNDLSGKYYLTADIVFSDEDFAEGGAFYNEGSRWIPIGTPSAPFTGLFDGNGHTISGLNISMNGSSESYGGLFGYVDSSSSANGIFNLGMLDAEIYIFNAVNGGYGGAVAGYCETGTIEGCYNTGYIAVTGTTGENYVGGIVGYKQYGEIKRCYNIGRMAGGGIIGGIVGATTYVGVRDCYSVGGSYGKYAGGIVGSAGFGTIDNCYSLKDQESSYGSGFAGGIVGMNSNCTVSNSYYTSNTSSGGGTKKTDAVMQSQSTFSGFDFTNVWTMDGNGDYPYPELQGITMHYERTLTGISVSTLPAKTVYMLNEEELDVTGGQIQLTYNDGTTSTVAMAEEMVSGFDNTRVGQQSLTVTYEGKTTTFAVTVKAPVVLSSITVSKLPNKMEYIVGEDALDVTGGVITLAYSDGTTAKVGMTEEMIAGFDNSKTGHQTLTVTYEGKTTTFTVIIKERVILNSISVFMSPNKTAYFLNEKELDVTGGIIALHYSDGTTSTIAMTAEMVTGFDTTQVGEQTLTVTYEDKIATFTVTVEIINSCGENITYALIDGVLTISGSGTMSDYASAANSPWYDQRESITKIVIEDGVTSIGDRAFYNCTNLMGVQFGNDITTVGAYAFRGCSKLTNITLPASTAELKGSAFRACSNLSKITLLGNAPAMGSYAFADCAASITIHYYEGSIDYDTSPWSDFVHETMHVGPWIVDMEATCTTLGSRHMVCSICGQTVTDVIASHIFNKGICTICGAAETIVFDACGNDVFWRLDALGTLTISGAGSIGSYSNGTTPWYAWRDQIKTIIIDDGITSISQGAFYGCGRLESITIPFVGGSQNAALDSEQYFGYIFGTSSYDGSVKTEQRSTSHTTISTYYIPQSLKSVTVTSGEILNGAFYNCTNLTSITALDNVTNIGGYAFYNCSSLASIAIPDSVTSIGGYAFYNCSSLASITIPDSVTSIGDSILSGCSNLASITIPFVGERTEHHQYAFGYIFGTFSYEGGVATEQYYEQYADMNHKRTYYIPAKLESVTVTGGNIPYRAFENCRNLSNITILDGITSIEEYAFYGCSGLTSITIPESVTAIPDYAFQYCSSLTSVTIGSNVSRIGTWAFVGCSNLIEVHITDIAAWCNISFADYNANPLCYAHNLYLNGELITDIIIPDNVTKIESYSFYTCSNLTSIAIPESVTSIGSNAFSQCSSLIGIHVEDSNTAYWSDEYGVLYNKEKTKLIQAPAKGIIGSYTIPDSVANIGSYAFHNCSGLTGISIPDSVTSIGSGAFSGCRSLTNIEIPDSVESIPAALLHGCGSLESITIPFVGERRYESTDAYQNPFGVIFGQSSYEGSTEIEQYYYGAKINYSGYSEYVKTSSTYYIPAKLNTVTITGGNILFGAFSNCSNLTTITLEDGINDIDSNAFGNCKISKIIIADGSKNIVKKMVVCKETLTEIMIPDSITSIEPSAFLGCNNLTAVHIDDISAWCKISFANADANPLRFAHNLYLNGEIITNLTIPNNVESISNYAFSGYRSLTSVTIPAGVHSIGDYVFSDCSSLIEIQVEDGNADYCSDEYGVLYNVEKTTLIQAPAKGIMGNYTVPESVTAIGPSAFSGCSGLTSITIPESVSDIGPFAFSGCSGLTSITIPESVSYIEASVFSGCSGLTSITIPGNVTSIGDYAFYNCNNINAVFYRGAESEKSNITIGASNTRFTNAKWHYNVRNVRLGGQLAYSCGKCGLLYYPDGAKASLQQLTLITAPDKDSYIVADQISLSGISLQGIYSNGTTVILSEEEIDCISADLSSPGRKIVVVTVAGASVNFEVYVHEGKPDVITIDSSLYPESSHNYSNNLNETKTFTYPGAVSLTITFNSQTSVENNYDYIYIYDGNDTQIAQYTGTTAAGKSLTISGDTFKVKLTSDGSNARYGYAFSSIKAKTKGAIHPAAIDPATATCTQAGLTEGSHCEICGMVLVAQEEMPALGHNYEAAFSWNEDHSACTCVLTCSRCTDVQMLTCAVTVTDVAQQHTTHCATVGYEGQEYNNTFTCDHSLITFANWDGTQLSSDYYHIGAEIAAPSNPTKAADETYTYTFAGWDKEVVDCAGDATYTATYTSNYIDYTVVFKNWNGDVLSTKTYHYGEKVEAPVDPTKAADKTYTYTFAGWDKEVVDCVGDATYTATYTSDYIDYTVVFKNWNGDVLSTKTYHYGEKVEAPADPTKAADKTYTYTFAGWDKEVVDCVGDSTYTATYESSYIDYVVKFLNADGTVLSEKTYHYGDKVTAPTAPTKAADKTYTYTFAGWDKEVVDCAGDATYTATYESNHIDYVVKFLDEDGTVISERTYHFGDKVTAPAVPTKTADNTYTYTFAGWDKTVVDCDGNATYTATYNADYIDYVVKFVDEDGTVISEKSYHYGDKVTAPTDPTKAANKTYTYTFTGWDKTVVDCDGNATYTATYTSNYIDYVVKFVDEDGTVISERTYHFGDKVTAPAVPTKAADNTYTYTFAGWDKDVVDCVGDATYTATYTSNYIDYTVVFKNWNGDVISTKIYHYGDTVEAPADPAKAADKTYTYTFVGWDKEVVDCAGDATYTATYTSNYIDYTVVFKNWNGDVLSTKTYHYGEKVTAPADPTKAADKTYTYTFAGWDKEVVDCAGDATYTATYTPDFIDYTVVFKNWNGDVLSTKTYHYGEKVTAPADPTKAADKTYTYTFAGWDRKVVDCVGDATYTATYTSDYIDYTVVFKNWNGDVISTKTYHYGDKVEAPADPAKAADKTYTYTFAGWDKDVVDCAGDATYTATYTPDFIDYTVVFKNWNGDVLSTKTYHYGDTAEVPANPTREANNTYTYDFIGWDKTVSKITDDAVYTATYAPMYISYTVIFQNHDGTVLSKQFCHYGDSVAVPAAPAVPEAFGDDYEFSGWDKEVTDCQGNAVYTAVFARKYISGDLTGDDKINSLDGLMLLRYLNGWNVNIVSPEAMDVNGDGKVNSLDGLILMRYLNGWNVTLG